MAGDFLLDIMPPMFIPAGVGLLTAWPDLKPVLVPVLVITVVVTVFVMVVTGRVSQRVDLDDKRERGGEVMASFFEESLFFGMAVSLIAYGLGLLLKKKLKWAFLNPLLLSIIVVILFLQVLHVDYETYNSTARYLSYLLTPATVCLAIPLYQQLKLLKENLLAVVLGIVSGVIASMESAFFVLALGASASTMSSM